MPKTSLEKSHSKVSNFKLTMINIIAAISFCLIFVGLILLNFNKILCIGVASSAGIVFLLSCFLISRFTR